MDDDEEDVIFIGKSKKRLNPALNNSNAKRAQYIPKSKTVEQLPNPVAAEVIPKNEPKSYEPQAFESSKTVKEQRSADAVTSKRTQKVEDFMDEEDHVTELTRPDAAIRREIADHNRLAKSDDSMQQLSIEHNQEEHKKLFKGIDWPFIERKTVETALHNEGFVPFKEDIGKQRRYKLFMNGSCVSEGAQTVQTAMITLMEIYRNALNFPSQRINDELKEFEETVKAVASIKSVALSSKFSKASSGAYDGIYNNGAGGITELSEISRHQPKPKDSVSDEQVTIENHRTEEKWVPEQLVLTILGIETARDLLNDTTTMSDNIPSFDTVKQPLNDVKRPTAADFF